MPATVGHSELTTRRLKFAILEMLADPRSTGRENRANMLGRPYQRGNVELHLDVTFDPEDRVRAHRAFDGLGQAGLIRPTYSDVVAPLDWFEITDAGRRALEQRALDDLDEALSEIGPDLVEMRDGAWAALHSGSPDSLRQAAHSARELMDQVMKRAAPDDEVMAQEWFQPDRSSNTGVTRRQRLRLISEARLGAGSASDLRIAEAADRLVRVICDELTSQSHARQQPDAQEVEDALRTAETALRRVLVRAAQ